MSGCASVASTHKYHNLVSCCTAIVLGVLLQASLLAAGTDVGFASLKIGIGSREWGMGSAGTADATGPQSMYWNPALNGWNGHFIGGPASADAPDPRFQASASYSAWLVGTGKSSVFVTRPTAPFVLGLGITSFSSGQLENRPDKPTDDPLGYYEPLDYSAYLNFSRALASFVSVGISGRFYYQKVYDLSASGVGLDVGVAFHPLKHLSAGLSVNDVGATMRFGYGDVQLPTRGLAGVSYSLPVGRSLLTAAGDFGLGFAEQSPILNLGAEFLMAPGLALRAGYRILGPTRGLTAGLGVKVKGLSLEYSLAMHDNDLGVTHQFALGFGY